MSVGANTTAMPLRLTCGVLVTDWRALLIGHAFRSTRWDIPKGLAEPGETAVAAAVRELQEETGLCVREDDLQPLGTKPYRAGKHLALFALVPPELPDPKALSGRKSIPLPGGQLAPELDRFALLPWREALPHLGRDMAKRLTGVFATLGRD